jgi:ATP-dependent DNA helicase PIF1
MNLSTEQQYAFDLFKKGKNVLITGPGGTGKTRLIEYLVGHSNKLGIKPQVCALTGCATILLPKICNARTLHSWSGIRLCKGENKAIVDMALKNKRIKACWKKTRVLIIDEVSMMSMKILEVLNKIGQLARGNQMPFGGIQLVCLGDFYQLPPVGNTGDPSADKFCFESKLWSTIFPDKNVVVLKTIFRQSDPEYKEILSQIRVGCLTQKSCKRLQDCVGREFDEEKYNGCRPTKLFPTRAKTDHLNNTMFAKLEGHVYHFKQVRKTDCKTYIESDKPLSLEHLKKCDNLHETVVEYELQQLLNNSSNIDTLSLKKGAIVMCTVNLDMDNGICNGSQGYISDIIEGPQGKLPEVTFVNGVKKTLGLHYVQSEEYPSIAIGYIPLCLAWALTIHKIQGATLTMADIDVGNQIFECGQTYVALSRVQSLEGLYLSAFNPDKIRINMNVEKFYKSLPENDYKIEETVFKQFELQEEEYVKDPTIKTIRL